MGRRAASEWAVTGDRHRQHRPAGGGTDAAQKSGARVDRMMFYTHGDPGGIQIGTSFLSVSGLRRFAGKGFEDLFTPGADVSIPGCKVPRPVARIGQGCADSKMGRSSWRRSRRSSSSREGVRVHGWDLNARGLPGIGVNYIRFWDGGNHWYAFIKKGESKSRLAMGNTLSTPVGMWVIYGTAVDSDCWFTSDGKVRRRPASSIRDGANGRWRPIGSGSRGTTVALSNGTCPSMTGIRPGSQAMIIRSEPGRCRTMR